MDIWIIATVAAALSQTVRSALQKALRDTLSTWGATAARFVYAAPLAALWLAALVTVTGTALPVPGAPFLLWGMVGGIAQILATGLLIHLFSKANFAIATAFTKTEPLQTAVFGLVLLGDQIALPGWCGILVTIAGVLLISFKATGSERFRFNQNVWLGVLSGGLFGLSAIAYRAASTSLPEGDFLLRASLTLACVTAFQAVAILLWLNLREPGETARLFAAWKRAAWVGLAGMLASLGWFTAFTLQTAAHVRALGQIEVIFTLLASVLFFRERLTGREIAGVALISAGVLALVLTG